MPQKIMFAKIKSDGSCEEVQLCNTVKDEENKALTDEKCIDYAISAETKENYVCLSNEGGTACEKK